MKYLFKYKLFEAKKSKNSEESFKTIVSDLLVDLQDKGFYFYIRNDKSTYTIEIRYRSLKNRNIESRYTFKWSDVKDDINMLIGYLQDTYPKMRFTEFSTDNGNDNRRKSYQSTGEFNKLDDSYNKITCIFIKFLIRFK